ncbi:glycosyltransferase [Cyanobacteria bacterium FACHB-63]|nr:glycosyltransferase [Cyanobacteria bacterium FACHB-63]
MRISVVIPTANRPDKVSRAVEKILENTIQPYEIVVVDQSQNNLTYKALLEFIEIGRITYIKEAISGASRARNIGWQRASGGVIAFTDDDALVDLRWLESIQSSFENTNWNIGVLGGKVIPLYEEKNPNWTISKRWEHLLPAYDQGNSLENFREGAFPATVNYSVYRSLLEKFGGFDENIGPHAGRKIQIPGEDAELALRLKKSGFNIIYDPNCVVYHPIPLHRQSLEFLNKSVLGEGARSAFLDIKANPNSIIHLIALLKSITKYFYLGLAKLVGAKNDEDLCYLYGRILVLFKCGFLKQDYSSL